MSKLYSFLKFFLFITLLIGITSEVLGQTGSYRSNNSGNWSTLSTWQRYNGFSWVTPSAAQGYPGQFASSSGASVTVRDDVTLNVTPPNSIGSLDVNNQAILNTSGNPSLTVTGNVSVSVTWIIIFPAAAEIVFGNGNLTIGGALTLEATCSLTFGSGQLTVNGNTSIEAAAQLINSGTYQTPGTVSIANVLVEGAFQNNGTASLTNTSAGVLSGAGRWTQGASSTLNYAGSTITVSTFQASASGNEVNYNRGGAQTVDNPTGSTYYHLTLSGSGVKTSSSDYTIAGDLTIGGSAQFDVDSDDDNLSVGGNWTVTSSNGNPFIEGTHTVTFNGNTVQTIQTSLAAGETFYVLTINNTSGTSPQIILNDKVSISSQLTMMDGIVQADATNTLIMLDNSSSNLGSAGSFVSGPVQFNMAVNGATRTLNFPIGKNNIYGAVALTIRHSSATSFSYTAEVVASSARALNYTLAPGTDRVSGLRYWNIRRGTTATPTATNNSNITTGANGPRLRIYYVAADEVTQPATLTVVKNTNGASAWNVIPSSASGSPTGSIFTNANAATFTSFSYFTLANLTGGTNPLPIELLSFSAQLKNNFVELKWSTASETNNDFFTIERSNNVEHFEPIFTHDGAGTTKELNEYNIVDPSPLYGRSYYRLKQTDLDGKCTYSSVRVIDYDGPEHASLTAFPNPASGKDLSIRIEGLRDAKQVPVTILNMQGQKVYEKTIEVKTPGVITEQIFQERSLPSGLYIIKAGNTLFLEQKIVIE